MVIYTRKRYLELALKLLNELGLLVDRLSANVELPTENGLKLLAPNKKSKSVIQIMEYVKNNKSKKFVPAGHSTQMIIGATNAYYNY